jgi:3-oxoacyl-[acyl-carrier-protein] synthase III
LAKGRISNVALRGVVCALPGNARKVEEFGGVFDPQEVEKIKSTVGLREVYRVQPGQTAGDLCIEAANVLLDNLGWERDTVDGIILVTQCPDYFCPATACVAHGKLGLSDACIAYDVNLGCSGYVYGLWIASQPIVSGAAKRILLLAGDTSSVALSPEDKSVAMLFGDAGTATALEFSADAEPMSFVMGTDGTGASNLIVPAGAYRMRPTPERFERTRGDDGNVRGPMDLYMDGLAIFNFTLQRIPPLVRDTLEQHGWEKEQVDAFLFHQANAFMLKTLVKKMKLPDDRVLMNIAKYGNTSLASIPLLIADDLSDPARNGAPNVLMAGFGIGYSWAAAALTLSGLKTAKVLRTEVGECSIHSI